VDAALTARAELVDEEVGFAPAVLSKLAFVADSLLGRNAGALEVVLVLETGLPPVPLAPPPAAERQAAASADL
jgi:hypothetical protein